LPKRKQAGFEGFAGFRAPVFHRLHRRCNSLSALHTQIHTHTHTHGQPLEDWVHTICLNLCAQLGCHAPIIRAVANGTRACLLDRQHGTKPLDGRKTNWNCLSSQMALVYLVSPRWMWVMEIGMCRWVTDEQGGLS